MGPEPVETPPASAVKVRRSGFFISRDINQLGAQDRPGPDLADGRRLARRICAGQLAVAGLGALTWLALSGVEAAYAAFAGGLIAFLPGLYFALRVFSRGPGSTPRSMLSALYRGETVKFILTAALFAAAIPWFADRFPALISTFIGALSVHWLALLEVSLRGSVREE